MGLLEELAVRCEAATEGDVGLNALIAATTRIGAFYPWALNYPEWEGRSDGRVYLEKGGPSFTAPSFTASLDAAISLVPEGWVMTLTAYGDCATVTLADDRVNPVRLDTVEVDAATPALALTAASLRARHALALSKGSDT